MRTDSIICHCLTFRRESAKRSKGFEEGARGLPGPRIDLLAHTDGAYVLSLRKELVNKATSRRAR